MRKLLFLLLVSVACMTKAGNNNAVTYLYQGADTEITDSATMHKIQLRKNGVIYVDGGVNDTLKIVKFRIGNGQWFDFKPALKPNEKMSQFFKEMPKVGKLAISSFGSMKELEKYKKENPKKNMLVAVVSFDDGKNLLFNNTSADIDVYMNDSFNQTLGKGGCMLVNKPADADSVNIVVACAKKLPTVVTVKFGEVTDDGVPAWWVAVTAVFALLVGVGVTIGRLIIRLKKKSADKSNKKKAAVVDANDFKLSVNKNPPSQFKGYEQRIGKLKQIICLMQTVKFPTNKDFLNNYIDEIVRYYGGNESIRKYIDDELKRNVDVQLSLDLPVTFSTKKPRNRDAWKKVKPGHNIYWVKFIAPFVEPDSLVSESTSLQSESALNDAKELVARLSALLPQQQDGEGVEVLPEKVEVNVGELYGVYELLKALVTTVKDELANIDEKIKNTNKVANNQMAKLKHDHEEEIKQLNDRNAKKWEEDTAIMKKQHEEAVKKAAKFEDDFKREKKAKREALETINYLNATIARKDEESKEYNTRLVFYRSCSEYATIAVEMFDSVNAVEQLASMLYNAYLENGRDRDTFCYYMTRINRKFLSSCAKIKNLHEVYEAELRMLAATGLVPRNGWIDRLLVSQKKESMWTWQLQAKLYRDVFEQYCGYAVIMADEYAYMMGKMLADIDKDIEKELVARSEHLQKLVAKLGYKLVYARPFTPITKYDNVENTDFVDLGIAKDTIVEIKKMGVAYGTKNPKTEVTVQQ